MPAKEASKKRSQAQQQDQHACDTLKPAYHQAKIEPKLRQLSSSRWALTREDLNRHFGEDTTLSPRFLHSLVCFCGQDPHPGFAKAKEYIDRAAKARQGENKGKWGRRGGQGYAAADVDSAMMEWVAEMLGTDEDNNDEEGEEDGNHGVGA